MTDDKEFHLEKTLLTLWFVVNLVIGLLTVRQYGVSIDEPNNYRYAADSLDAYPSFFGALYEPKYDPSYDGHGPAFVTLVAILIGIVQGVFPNVFTPDLWHFSYFITFQLTGLCLYWLARRWFSSWTAWGVLILFGTQPLLLGHAFVNPKDIPFMFLLTWSLLSGFRLVDSLGAKEPFVSLKGSVAALAHKFQGTDPRRRWRFLTWLALAVVAALALFVFAGPLNSLVEQVVTFFYRANPDSWSGRIFSSVASRASEISVQDYTAKVLRWVRRAEVAMLVAGLLFFSAYFGLLINNTTLLRSTREGLHTLTDSAGRLAKSLLSSLRTGPLQSGFTAVLRAVFSRRLLFAGIALGLATGLRAIAPWAGVIVFIYLLVKAGYRAWTMAVAYFLVAGTVTYLAWPHLWDAPVQRYLEGLGVISAFPDYPQRVLFNGHYYGDTALPRSYLPILMNIQFTEPGLACIYLGLAVLAWRLLRGRLRMDLLLYVSLGFILPLAGLVLLRPPLYNNFRQVLFLVPAMFMLAAFALELLFARLSQGWARLLLIAAIALPGVYSTVRLYPYEYIYYNSLAGGLAGAHDRYELDYMRISLREAALVLNEVASPGATIVVNRSAGLFVIYARSDLVVDKVINSILNLEDGFDYAVEIVRGRNWDIYPDSMNVIIIERDGAVLAAVKDLRKTEVK